MSYEIMEFSGVLFVKQAAQNILECNKLTQKYGLVLTKEAAAELVEVRTQVLRATGRIEFGAGIINKIIREFCDSPYLTQQDYQETIESLIEIFYYYKNETLDILSDDELIKFMKNCFDGVCQGSVALLQGKEVDRIARNLRFGRDAEDDGENNSREDIQEEENELY